MAVDERYAPDGTLISRRQIVDTPEAINQETLRTRLEGAIDALRAIKDSQGTLTAAQLSNAVRVLARALLAILRLQLNRLDDVDGA